MPWRTVALLDSPQDIGPLAPLVLREITYGVLSGPQSSRLRQTASAGPADRAGDPVAAFAFGMPSPS